MASIPSKLTISLPKIQRHPLGQHLESQFADRPTLTAQTRSHLWLYTFLIHQKYEDANAFWKPYVDSLPRETDTPLWWDKQEVDMLLAGTNAHTYVQEKLQNLQHEFRLARELCGDYFPNGSLTWENYLWAHTIYLSRAFPMRFNPDGNEIYGDPRLQECSMCLWPVLDMLNHQRGASITWTTGPEGVCFVTGIELQAGMEIFNNYGPKSNAEWLLGYAFVMPNNPEEFVTVKINLGRDPLKSQKRRILEKTGKTVLNDAVECVVTADRSSEVQEKSGITDVVGVLNLLCESSASNLSQLSESISTNDQVHPSTFQASIQFTALNILHNMLVSNITTLTNLEPRNPFTKANFTTQEEERSRRRFELSKMYRQGQVHVLQQCVKETKQQMKRLLREHAHAEVSIAAMEGDDGFMRLIQNIGFEGELEEETLMRMYIVYKVHGLLTGVSEAGEVIADGETERTKDLEEEIDDEELQVWQEDITLLLSNAHDPDIQSIFSRQNAIKGIHLMNRSVEVDRELWMELNNVVNDEQNGSENDDEVVSIIFLGDISVKDQ